MLLPRKRSGAMPGVPTNVVFSAAAHKQKKALLALRNDMLGISDIKDNDTILKLSENVNSFVKNYV